MIRVELKLVLDDEVTKAIDSILSGCLPHENSDAEAIPELFREMSQIVQQEELPGPHYILYKILNNLTTTNYRIKSYKARFTKDILEDSLASQLEDLIRNPDVRIHELIQETGSDIDLTLPDGFKLAQDLLYTETIDKYDELYDLAQGTVESFEYLQILKQEITRNLTVQALQIQAEILNDGVEYNRRKYVGVKDHNDFINEVYPTIQNRFVGFLDDKVTQVELTDMDSLTQMLEKDEGAILPVSSFGYEPLDEITKISTSDVITIIGDEGVGKTTMMIDYIYNTLMEGRDALVMTGESKPQKILFMLVARHAYEQHGVRVNSKEVASLRKEDSEIGLMIRDSLTHLIETESHGKIILTRQFHYETFYQEVEDYARKYPNLGNVFIDHADRLASKNIFTPRGMLKSQKERVDYLYMQAVDISDTYPIGVIILAHTSADANKTMAKDKDPGVRIGASSSSTTKDADIVLLLSKNAVLESEGLIRVAVTKMREYRKPKPFILKIEGEPSRLIYDAELQYKDGEVEEDTSSLI